MRTQLMRSSNEHRDSYAPSNSSSCSLMSETFDSSFNSSFSSSASSAASWDMSPPSSSPTRRESYGSLDLEGLSSCPSTHLNTPATEVPVHLMTNMTQDLLANMQDMNYFTPCTKVEVSQNMMNFDFSYPTAGYSPFESQQYNSGMIFDNTSPPMDVTTASPHYVNPSQTFLQPYVPATPLAPPRQILSSSPLDGYGSSTTNIRYFLTPTPSRSAHSSTSFSSADRSPCDAALASSAALHRVQGSNRIRKQPRKSQLFAQGISRVIAGQFACDFPGCESKHSFKRQEHLKRHKKTHLAQKDLHCTYCQKKFQQDRADNYRSHVRLHADPDKKGSRTKYFPEAEAEVASWAKDRSRGERLAPAAQISRGQRSRGMSTRL